jgi:hemerythrin
MTREEFIAWTKKMSVHIKDIDEQHKHLLDLINRADKYLEHGKKDDLKEIVNELVEYTRVHFSTEERYFEKWDYPYADEHNKAHAKLISNVLEYKDRFDKGEDIAFDLLVFLKGWWEIHLKIDDHKYSKYFAEKGYIE